MPQAKQTTERAHTKKRPAPPAIPFLSEPNRAAALAQYRSRIPVYDLEIAPTEPIRRRAVMRLELKSGDVVIDAGCGTGLSFAHLERPIGPGGAIIGVEQSPEMLALARQRVNDHEWTNVTLINAAGEDARLPQSVDAILFQFTHDLLQTPAALENLFSQIKPGARVVATGLKWASWWSPAVNLFVQIAAMRSATTLAGLDEPWRYLKRFVNGLVVESFRGGGTFLAYGWSK